MSKYDEKVQSSMLGHSVDTSTSEGKAAYDEGQLYRIMKGEKQTTASGVPIPDIFPSNSQNDKYTNKQNNNAADNGELTELGTIIGVVFWVSIILAAIFFIYKFN